MPRYFFMPHQHRVVAAGGALDYIMDSSNRHGTIIGVASTLYPIPILRTRGKMQICPQEPRFGEVCDDNID